MKFRRRIISEDNAETRSQKKLCLLDKLNFQMYTYVHVPVVVYDSWFKSAQ